MGGIRDQLAFYYNNSDYEMFLKFFTFLGGKADFSFETFMDAYNNFSEYILIHHDKVPEFREDPTIFLQFLYDTNIICYINYLEKETFFRFCYRERSPSNISPKVRLEANYRIHYGLQKALNLGSQKIIK